VRVEDEGGRLLHPQAVALDMIWSLGLVEQALDRTPHNGPLLILSPPSCLHLSSLRSDGATVGRSQTIGNLQ
jgi:hypothetical protein